MEEAHERLIEIIKLIEEHYGKEKITPNLHLSLHLCECAYDYGPLYAFWCFSFERMNGILGKTKIYLIYFSVNFSNSSFIVILLGSLPNSRRRIEPELMRRLMAEAQINDIISACRPEVRGLELFNNRPSVGSLSDTDELPTDEMYRFLMNSVNISQFPITGCEKFLVTFYSHDLKIFILKIQFTICLSSIIRTYT